MLEGFIPIPLTTEMAAVHYRPQPIIRAEAAHFSSPWPLRQVGTGGFATESFVRDGIGYAAVRVLESKEPTTQETTCSSLMHRVREGFGRTMSRLPEVFGVSRQTLYNWLDGETPRPVHQARLVELAAAADVFLSFGFRPNAASLDRTLSGNKSFLKMLADGVDGREAANTLIRVERRASQSRSRLDALLVGRMQRPAAADIGSPALDEDR